MKALASRARAVPMAPGRVSIRTAGPGRVSTRPAVRKPVLGAPVAKVVAWDGNTFRCRVDIKTRNPNNGQTGNSRLAGIIRSRERRLQRGATKNELLFAQWSTAFCHKSVAEMFPTPVVVTMRRVAPSAGLDPHDGLRAALKGPVDGVSDWLGLKSDRDPRVRWDYDQRRGRTGEYAVEIEISHARSGE